MWGNTNRELSDGKRYFFNYETGECSWEKPTKLMTPNERAHASSFWRIRTTDDGKKYYYNVDSTHCQWTIPDILLSTGIQPVTEDNFIAVSLGAKENFKALLHSVGVGSNSNWEQVEELIKGDQRYVALNTLRKRKYVFYEYMRQMKKMDAGKKRQRLAAEDFTIYLSNNKEITSSSTWEENVQLLENRSEYMLIGDDAVASGIFDHHVSHLQETERKVVQQKARMEKWRECKEKLLEKQKEKDRKENAEKMDRYCEKEEGKERPKKEEKKRDKDRDRQRHHRSDDASRPVEKKRNNDRDRKHRKGHHSSDDDTSRPVDRYRY